MYLDGAFSNNIQNLFTDNIGVDSSSLNSVSIGKGSFTANFFWSLNSYEEQTIAKHEIYSLFGQRDILRIRTSESPFKCYYARPTTFELNSITSGNNDMKFSIVFDVPSGYAYSTFRSDELDQALEVNVDYGMNKIGDIGPYTSASDKFIINNSSDVVVDPYFQKHDLKIIIKSNGPIVITNRMNGTQWAYTGKISFDDEIVIDRIATLKNGIADSVNTDFGFIKLERGRNEIEVSGDTTLHSVTFSFPFLYIN